MVSFTKRLSLGGKRLAIIAIVAAAVAPSISACADNTVFELSTSLDAAGFRPRNVFYTDTQTIYCLAKYVAARNNITFNGVVRYVKDETGAATDVVVGVYEIAPGISHGVLTIPILPPAPPPNAMSTGTEPFPVGTYRCEWYVDSLPPGSAENKKAGYNPCGREATCSPDFKVTYPDCPVDYAHANTRCGGFYKDGASCRGATSKEQCTCSYGATAPSSVVWACQ
jgi:hypothetical protein